MLPTLLFQTIGFLLNLIIVLFLVYYLIHLRSKAREMEAKERKIDTNYHQVVDNALTKERKILEDATAEADKILTDAKYVNQTSLHSVDEALAKMIADIKTETGATAQDFRKSYGASLEQIATGSLHDFQGVSKQLQVDLQAQLKHFTDSLIPAMEKELDVYKQERLKQAEQTITKIVQQASQDILNKSISFEDHQKLMIDSLEKAKKEGLFG